MADQARTTVPQVDETTAPSDHTLADKGKGKAPAVDQPDYDMGEASDVSEESEREEEGAEAEDEEEEDMQEIDLDNIVAGGRRTRGKVIDFAKAAEDSKGEIPEDDDEDDDEDFEAPDEEMEG